MKQVAQDWGWLCSWDVRLAALKSYYGQPQGNMFPFAYLNPGGYIGNVTFWLHALKEYELGQVGCNTSHLVCHAESVMMPALSHCVGCC